MKSPTFMKSGISLRISANYSYMLQTGDIECKTRGFTLDEQGYELLNFESIKRHILAQI